MTIVHQNRSAALWKAYSAATTLPYTFKASASVPGEKRVFGEILVSCGIFVEPLNVLAHWKKGTSEQKKSNILIQEVFKDI